MVLESLLLCFGIPKHKKNRFMFCCASNLASHTLQMRFFEIVKLDLVCIVTMERLQENSL